MNFEDISKKFMKFSKDTVTEVQKMNEVRQLNAKVNEEKKNLNRIYLEMGKKLYDMYKEAPLEGFEDEIRTIGEKFTMIDLLQDQIRAVKGVALCPCCNTEVGLDERFCSNCGNRMPQVFTIEEDEEVETIEGTVEEVAEEAAEEVVEKAAETVEATEEAVEEAAETEEAAEVVEEAAETAEESAKEN